MGNGAAIPHDKLASAKQKLEGCQKNAAAIIELAVKANPGDETWGKLGTWLFEPWAERHLDDTYDHLKQMGECLNDHVVAVDDVGKGYQAKNEALIAAINKIGT